MPSGQGRGRSSPALLQQAAQQTREHRLALGQGVESGQAGMRQQGGLRGRGGGGGLQAVGGTLHALSHPCEQVMSGLKKATPSWQSQQGGPTKGKMREGERCERT